MKPHAALLLLILLACAKPLLAGPPFQTDDPEPVDFQHYEFYAFGAADGTGVEMDTVGPAAEFNWGVLPNTQFHIVVPAASAMPSNLPKYSPAGVGPSAFGMGDIEMGVKYKWIKETKHRPIIGTFTMIEVPTGNYDLGLGVGKVWWKLPVWAQKSFGPWTTYGGVGEEIVPQTGYKDFTYGGWLVQDGPSAPKFSRTAPKGSPRRKSADRRSWISAATTTSKIPAFNCFSVMATRSRDCRRLMLTSDCTGRGGIRKTTRKARCSSCADQKSGERCKGAGLDSATRPVTSQAS